MVLREYTYKVFSSLFAGTAVAIAGLVLVGWQFNITLLKTPLPGLVAMNPTAAVTFMLAAFSFFLMRARPTPASLYVGRAFALLVFLMGFFKLLFFLGLMTFNIDQHIFPTAIALAADTPPGIAPSSATNFIFLGIVLHIFSIQHRKEYFQGLALVIVLIAWFSVLGYINQVPEFYGGIPYLPMSFHSAICFLCLAVALILYYPDKGFMKQLTGTFDGSRVARWLVPTALFVPLGLGYIRLWGHWLNMFTTEFGVSILVFSITVVFLGVVWFTIVRLNRRDQQRRVIENSLKSLNTRLRAANDEVANLNEELQASNEELYQKNNQLLTLNEQLQDATRVIATQANTIVKQKDEQLNRVLETSNDVVWSVDLTGNGLHYISRSTEKLFNQSPLTLGSHRHFWTASVLDDDRAAVQACVQHLYEQGTAECLFRMPGPDAERWMFYKGRLVKNEGGEVVREDGIISDLTNQKKMEKEMARYQGLLDIIFSNTIEEILLMDAEGKVLIYNQAFYNFMTGVRGTPPQVGQYLWDTTVPERSQASLQLFNRALQGEFIKTEALFPTPYGDIIHLLRYEPVIRDGVVTHVCIISTDITSEKARDASLRSILDSTEDSFTVLDKDFNIVTFNKRATEVTQRLIGKELVQGNNFMDLMSPERRAVYLAMMERVKQGEIVRYDIEQAIENERVWYHISITPVLTEYNELKGYCFAAHDYTEQKQAEADIVWHQERFKALVEHAEDLIGMMNDNGQITYISPSVERIMGYQPAEFMNLVLKDLVHPRDEHDYLNFLARVAGSPGKLLPALFRTRHKKGRWLWLEGTAINLLEVGSIRGFVLNFRDVTERKKAEEEKNGVVQQLIQQNENLMQFSFIASHNLRGPVASMLGLLNLMNHNDLTGEVADLMAMLRLSTIRLDEVIKDLTTILEIRGNELHAKEPVRMQEILVGILETLESQIRETNAEINLIDDDAPVFYTHKTYFYSIVYNLLSNALKYRDPERTPRITVSTFKRKRHMGFIVTDNGLGIDLEKYRDKVFTLYQRFHLDVPGKGLGLFLVKTQVQSLNGTIEVYSAPGMGASFAVSLPLVRVKSSPAEVVGAVG